MTARADAPGSTGERGILSKIPKNVFWLGMVSFFNDFGSEMILAVLPVFLVTTLGASMSVVGLIDGVAESTASLLKVFSGALSDRFERRRPLVVGGYALSNLAQPLIGLAQGWGVVLPLRFVDRVGKGIRSAPRDAIIADSVDSKNRGLAYGFHRAMDSAGGVLGPLAAFAILALLATRTGIDPSQAFSSGLAAPDGHYRIVILAAVLPNIVAVVLVFLVKERPREPAAGARLRLSPPSGPFRVLLAAATLFGLGSISYSFVLLRSGGLGVALILLPLVYLLFHLGQTLFATPLGTLSDRVGRKRVIGLGYGSFALMCLGWVWATAPWHAVALSALYGFSLACTEGTVRALAVDLVPAERRGAALGLLHGFVGLAALPSSLVAGLLWDRFGADAAFAWGGVLAAAGAVVLLFVRVPYSE